jgi:sarcosine oxidase
MDENANTFDVIVVGVGAMGSAACFELARRGVRVLGLEQSGIAHDRGSSHGLSRMIRLAYYEHPDYVPLLRRAYERWKELEWLSGQTVLNLTGGLYMGPADGVLVSGSLESARRHHLPGESLDHAAILARFGQFKLPQDFSAVYEPMAGYIAPERAVSLLARQAQLAGAVIHGHEPVRDWQSDTRGVTVITDRARYSATQLVFCGGSWSARLLRDLDVQLVVTRQVMGWLWPREPARFDATQFPCWAIERPDGSIYYGFPMAADEPGLKMAHHHRGPVTDPDHVAREITEADEREIRAIALEFLPAAIGPIVSIRVCLYTNSPDSHFIIGRHPGHERVSIACGFSGHGFKFASVIGEILADLAAKGSTTLPIEFLSPARFRGSRGG